MSFTEEGDPKPGSDSRDYAGRTRTLEHVLQDDSAILAPVHRPMPVEAVLVEGKERNRTLNSQGQVRMLHPIKGLTKQDDITRSQVMVENLQDRGI